MNILLVNHYAGSPQMGMEYRPYYLSKEWINKGHNVMILASSFSHIRSHQPDMNNQSVMDEKLEGITYRWYHTSEYSGNGVRRVLNILTFLKAVWRDRYYLVNTFSPDIVIASSTYPMDIWPARKIAMLSKAKLIFEVHDLWPLSPMTLGSMSRWHPFIIWCQQAEDYAYRYADKVVSILPKTLDHMVSHGMNPDKFNYIPNGVALEEWKNLDYLPDDVHAELQRIKQRGLPIVAYTGTHGLANALDVLLDAAKDAAGIFEVILIGPGPDRERLKKRVKDEHISNVTMLNTIPKTCIPYFLKEIDIAYIGWHKNPLYRFGITPNKLMDYMMAAKPIVHSVEAGNDPVDEAKCGITVPPLDARAIRDAIIQIGTMTETSRNIMGNRGKQFILSEQTYSILGQRFLDILEKLND